MTIPPKRPKPGDLVVIGRLPSAFLDGLPVDDQKAITGILGKPIRFVAYDEHDRAELEFTDTDGVIHVIYVETELLKTEN